MTERRYRIRVPASSANIGPGFDVLGLALGLHTTLDVTIQSSPADASEPPRLSYTGEGADEAPLDPYKNLITRVALYVLRCHGHRRFPPGVRIHVDNQIPFGRGMGSSGAAVVAGVLLGDCLGGLGLSDSRRLDFALMVERHPDNVAASLLGGFIAAYLRELDPAELAVTSIPLAEVLPEYPPDAGEAWGLDPPMPPAGIGHVVQFPLAPAIRAIAVVPRFELSTAKARDALPPSYSRQDCVFNMQRVAVLTAALGQAKPSASLVYAAMQDRIHQQYRSTLVPALSDLLASVRPEDHPGLLGLCLSGAGPTVLVLATGNYERIAAHVAAEWKTRGAVEADWRVLELTPDRASLEELPAGALGR